MRTWLIAIREHKGMSQKAVSEAVGVSQPTYWEYEHGDSTPSVAVAKRIAAVLGFDWTLFYEGSSEVIPWPTKRKSPPKQRAAHLEN